MILHILIVLSVAVFIGFSLGFLSKWVNNKIKKKNNLEFNIKTKES